MERVAEAHAEDLTYLRGLLVKHDIPASVCIKLMHIHFHLNQGEVLVVRELDASPYGKTPFLEPVMPDAIGQVYGCNYIVDDSGDLQAFEYTTIKSDDVDLAAYPAFVSDFCTAVVRRGVQHKFGLAINSGAAKSGSWTELDFPEKRATFLLPDHVPLPQNDRLVWRRTITKFSRPTNDKSEHPEGRHGHAEHYWGGRTDVDGESPVDGVMSKNGLHLTGVPLEPGTAFYTVASAIAAAG